MAAHPSRQDYVFVNLSYSAVSDFVLGESFDHVRSIFDNTFVPYVEPFLGDGTTGVEVVGSFKDLRRGKAAYRNGFTVTISD